jgi:hypothetical protein
LLYGVAELLSPAIAGALYYSLPLNRVLLIAFLFCLGSLVVVKGFVRIPSVETNQLLYLDGDNDVDRFSLEPLKFGM